MRWNGKLLRMMGIKNLGALTIQWDNYNALKFQGDGCIAW